MNVERNLLVLLTLAAVASPALGQVTVPAARQANGSSKSAVASPASGQQTAPSARPAKGGSKSVVASPAAGPQAASAAGQTNKKSAASIPDFSGIWRHGSLPSFVPPASGPGPVTNRTRRKG